MEILSVRLRTNREFEEHYKDEFSHGGLFCPTTTELEDGTEVIVELNAPALPNKVMIRGIVRSWRPALPRLRVRAGAVVEFLEDENDKHEFIVETIRGKRSPARKRRHSRLPLAIPVKYRTTDSADMIDCQLSEISVGGALLLTPEPLPMGTDIIVEVLLPGSVASMSISGSATYKLDSGATGLKFVYRDAGGNRRLRELVRRLRDES